MRPRTKKIREVVIAFLIAAAITMFLILILIWRSPPSHSYPGCTNEQPYPSNGFNVCTGYGQECPRVVCAYQPGTPGRFDVNGDYQPRYGN